MRFLSKTFTDPGGRDPNEDSVGAYSAEKFSAWIAADGLGGHVSGELASSEAVHSLENSLKECKNLDRDFVEQSFRDMNAAVEALEGPLTTAVCAFSDGKTLYYGNNGDSRFFFLRDRKIISHTNDHSLAYLAYLTGTISYDEIPSHPAQNRLYHCIGNEPEFSAELYDPISLQPGDAFLLCTDGFWELISLTEIERTLNIAQTPDEWMEFMLGEVRPRLKPTSDNYTAVCVMVRED